MPVAQQPTARASSAAVTALALAVGIVLADSAIVTLALPSILGQFDAEVSQVAWVLTGFNLVLALAAVPAARLCTRGAAGSAAAAGLATFAAASAACALAGSLELLIGARVVQALGGALVIASCLELLVAASGDEQRGVRRWAAAGVTGTAIGPVVGGLMTETISWQSIFILQVPLVLLALPVAWSLRGSTPRHDGPSDRPDLAANFALALVSAALTAALFLLVLLLVEGWSRTPALAAVTVTVIPVAALLAAPLSRAARAGIRAEAIAGAILIGGGLACLGLLPAPSPWWTVPAQLLIGLGLGLTIDSLTRSALRDRVPRALHGGWTIAARHGGIVVGLLILTPIFTADLRAAQRPAQEVVVAEVLDADLPASSKLALAEQLAELVGTQQGQVPDLHEAFAKTNFPVDQLPAAAELEAALDNQLQRVATDAFQRAFFAAAVLALLAIVPALFLQRREPLA